MDGETRNPLQLFTEWLSPTDVRITVAGNVDMCTAHQLSHYVLGRAGNCKRLTVDMTRVSFFDCAGISALYYIDERCRRANVTWIIEPSHCVSRVIGMGDPLCELPMTADGEFESACA
ncbi:Sulfate transporter/antisigma-factor antagonist STAS [Mycolicibacterium rhodesiae JS60]|nr:Sulfate transporter/antisigma-factor antagonist STAS [Mycolicibacterium rhodesiae JS60]